jgi:protein SCO1/2
VPFYADPSYTPIWKLSASSKNSLHTIAAFSFTNQDGTMFSNQDVKHKIYLANFFFTTCHGICPKMTNNVKKVYTHFKGNKDVLFLSYSVTPEIDSVPKLRAFAAIYNIQTPQWQLLTGAQSAIYDLARKSFYVEEADGLSKDSTEFLHTENLVLIDKQGHIRGLYNGTIQLEADRIIADVDVLLGE